MLLEHVIEAARFKGLGVALTAAPSTSALLASRVRDTCSSTDCGDCSSYRRLRILREMRVQEDGTAYHVWTRQYGGRCESTRMPYDVADGYIFTVTDYSDVLGGIEDERECYG
jgi:hypothetical protein